MSCSVSVVIPAFNSARVLPDAIGSVRGQTGHHPEIIVIDDGSTDDTPRVLETLAGSDLRVLKQGNGGPGAARNTGIRAAQGRWVAFLDADDVWTPGKLSAQLAALEAGADLAFSYSDGILRAPDGAERTQKPRRAEAHLFLDLLQGPEFITATAVVRRDCFDQVGFFDTDLRTGEDWDMWLRLAANFDGCYVPQALCVYKLPDKPRKYASDLLERCTLRVIRRALNDPSNLRRWPEAAAARRRVYAWHCSVLAKSHFRQHRFGGFVRMGLAAVGAHPAGAGYLARSYGSGELPRLIA